MSDVPHVLTRGQRAAIAAVAGVLMALLTYRAYGLKPPMQSDFDFVWIGLNAFVHGRNPYQAVADAQVRGPLYYPMPALVAFAPLGYLSAGMARILFAGLGYAALAYAAAGRPGGLFVCLLSASAIIGGVGGQWSPLLTAGAAAPWLSALWVCKPGIGLALWCAYPSRWAVIGGIALLLLSFVLMPSWLGEWRQVLGSPVHAPPLLRPGGFLLLAALLRWRRPEGRLLAALCCLPHVTTLYETVPLFLVPSNRHQAYLLLVLSYVAAVAQAVVQPDGSLLEQVVGRWPVLLICLYLPALVMVMLRPNECPDAAAEPTVTRTCSARPCPRHRPRSRGPRRPRARRRRGASRPRRGWRR
jgi:hypothetical protein